MQPASPPSASVITSASTIGAIILARPVLIRLFEALGVDHRRSSDLSLNTVCMNLGLDVATAIVLIKSAAMALEMPPEIKAEDMTITQLADHIESTHHTYVKKEIPRLLEMARVVVARHGQRDPRLLEVNALVQSMAAEFQEHMEEEEAGLFPFMRRAEAGTSSYIDGKILDDTLRQMEDEHEATDQVLARLRALTDGFTYREWSCETHRALLTALEEFEGDLHVHVHKENNILFPRTFALASL